MNPALTRRIPTNRKPNSLPKYLKFLVLAQIVSAFFTETRFLPLKHNVGAFEFTAVVLTGAALIYFVGRELPLRSHRVLLPLFILAVVAGVSYYQLMSAIPERQSFGALSVIILIVSVAMAVVWYNLLLVDEETLDHFIRAITYTAGVIALWILYDSIRGGGAIGIAGPFRNRAHAGIYMHSAFWLVLAKANWPKTKGLERVVTYLILGLVLYTIATAGRRSVYFALGVGFVGLAGATLFAGWHTRQRVVTLLMVSATTLGLVYFVLSDFWLPAAFFKERITMVDERLQAFTTSSVEDTEIDFIVLQRQGVIRGFLENPILGIGYGGFAKSEYSPTEHEVHSTPLRFLVELGVVGIALYAWFMLEVAGTAFRVWRVSRGGPYETAALILLMGILALTVSYTYNRQMTERIFWLYLAFIMALDTRLKDKMAPRQVGSSLLPSESPLHAL